MNKPEFRHLLQHYRCHKLQLACSITLDRVAPNRHTAIEMGKSFGALECLYCQALGKGLLNLAKGIRRTIAKAEVTTK